MKEELLLHVAAIFSTFKFRDPFSVSEGYREHYIVFVDTERISHSDMNQLFDIKPFIVDIKSIDRGFQIDFRIKR